MTPKRIYMRELTKLPEVNRRPATIRKWDREAWLPPHLRAKRDEKGWRYWTHTQVYGRKGIIAWMKENDMRPGRLVADPEMHEEHIKNLRRPRYLNGYHIKSIRAMVKNGKSREQIIRKIYPKTQYSSPENLERVVVKLFEANGWDFPAAPEKPKMSKRQRSDIKRLQKRVKRIIAD